MTSNAMTRTCLAAAALLCALPGCAAARPALQARRGAYELEVLVNGAPAPTFWHRGETYVLGRLGERYTLRLHNRTDRRVEVVVSVDGRDVLDGEPAGFAKGGYLVPAHGAVEIDGWRLSLSEVAAFRFSRVADSYAARTGSARDVGVIGVAVFPERWTPPPPPAVSERSAGEAAPSRDAAPAASAPAPAAGPERRSAEAKEGLARRPGLGTEFGERVASEVAQVHFERAGAAPAATLGARYDDAPGLAALGIPVDGAVSWREQALRRTASPFPAEPRFARPPPGW